MRHQWPWVRSIGQGELQRSLPTSAIVWFCNIAGLQKTYFRSAFFLKHLQRFFRSFPGHHTFSCCANASPECSERAQREISVQQRSSHTKPHCMSRGSVKPKNHGGKNPCIWTKITKNKNCLSVKLFWKFEGDHCHKRKDAHFASWLSEAKLPKCLGNDAQWDNEGSQTNHLLPHQQAGFTSPRAFDPCFFYTGKHIEEYTTNLYSYMMIP